MKIALVLECFDPMRGGLESWTARFARELFARGFDIHVICCEAADGPHCEGLTIQRAGSFKHPLERARAVDRLVAGGDYDLVHDMGCGLRADVYHPHGGSARAFREHNLMRIPKWRQIRIWRERRYREQEDIQRHQLTGGARRVVAVSGMVKRHLIDIDGVSGGKIQVIPNGVDTGEFSPERCRLQRDQARKEFGFAEEDVVFLLLAHNLKLKNARAAIHAMGKIQDKPVRLLVAGSRKPGSFPELAERMGLGFRVRFAGPRSDSLFFYAAADACVHPTWYDPCSLVTLEALACGLPVITTRFNGVSETFEHGKEGFLMDHPSDSAGLAGFMDRLCCSEVRRNMSEKARDLSLNHDLQKQTQAFLDLYQELTEKQEVLP